MVESMAALLGIHSVAKMVVRWVDYWETQKIAKKVAWKADRLEYHLVDWSVVHSVEC
jgi:hypothetical protein